jgi:hypothetical protein
MLTKVKLRLSRKQVHYLLQLLESISPEENMDKVVIYDAIKLLRIRIFCTDKPKISISISAIHLSVLIPIILHYYPEDMYAHTILNYFRYEVAKAIQQCTLE